MNQHPNQVITQYAYVVPDLDKAVARWRRMFNLGPVFMLRHVPVHDVTYRGAPAELDFSGAVAYAGHVQIEWIQQHNDAPSAYRDIVPEGAEGLHHMCFYPDDYEAELARYQALGFPIATGATLSVGDGVRLCYLDARPQLNCMIELVDMRPEDNFVSTALREATDNWDGVTDPIREFDLS